MLEQADLDDRIELGEARWVITNSANVAKYETVTGDFTVIETGGFTEFVPLPFVHMEAPIWRKGRARSGPSYREAVLMHAVARIVLHPLIPNIQVSWVKMGADGIAISHDGERLWYCPLISRRWYSVDTAALRSVMETAFGASDANGAWDWKLAYEACEVATVLFLRKYGKALFRKAASPASRLGPLAKIAGLLPTQTRRSEESQSFQQFSTPLPLGLAALAAAAITPDDVVLEPSAGTGLLAILAEIAGGTLLLNELAEMRAGLLSSLFPALSVTRFDAAQIDDHLDPCLVPTVVLMNPPFSVMANVEGRMRDAAFRHVASALARLAPGVRLVTITGASFAPDNPAWTASWTRLQERGRVTFSAAIDGSVLAMPDGRLYWMYCASGPENGVYIAPMASPTRVAPGARRTRFVAGTTPPTGAMPLTTGAPGWRRSWRRRRPPC